jgi:Protein of unknown function (DUF2442)
MAISEAEFRRANERMRERCEENPLAVSAGYDSGRNRIVITFNTGADFSFSPEQAQGLEHATPEELSKIEISPSGLGIHFPELDADFDVPSLLLGAFGTRRWMAAKLGREGGKARSDAKRDAAKNNGRLGGRPKKVTTPS